MSGLRIVIPGGSGQVGSLVARHFHTQGHHVTVLTRDPKRVPWKTAHWTGREPGPWRKTLDGADIVINLAGRSVNCRYTQANRQEIQRSRVETTRLVGRAIAEAEHPPKIWINASTATIYRHALDRPMDEDRGELGGSEPDAPSSWRFSIDVARSWEQAFFEAPAPGLRKIAIRSALTLSPSRGGIFDALLGLVRAGLGGTTGSGSQFVSWIHWIDFLRAIDFLLAREELNGVINLASPNPLPNRDFMRILRQAWGARIGLPVTDWMLEIGAVLLQTETELVLKSRRVVPTRLLAAGFDFNFPDWGPAAKDLVDSVRTRRSRLVAG